MPIPDITFNVNQGGLGRQPAGEDHISGALFYTSTLPSGFDSSNRIKQVFSLSQAENLGILATGAGDETKAGGTYTITNEGVDGDTITIQIATNISSLGFYGTVGIEMTLDAAAVVTKATCAQFIVDFINNNPVASYGFTATTDGVDSFTVFAPAGYGVYPNNTMNFYWSYSFSVGATWTADFVQAAEVGGVLGVASKIAVFHYHISEYFRLKPNGNLYIGIYAAPTTNYTEVTTLRDFARGTIRQMLVFHNFAASNIATTVPKLQTAINNSKTDKRWISSILFAPEISATTNLSSLNNLVGLSSANVSVVISQDGAATGYSLFNNTYKSISDVGAKLGALSAGRVNQSWAWVAAFPMSNGVELDTLAFSTGVLYNTVPRAQLDALNDYAYCFLRKFTGYTGSYNNQPNTCALPTSDFRYIYNNRVIDKAERVIYASTIPALSSPITLNSDGTMSESSVAYFESLANMPLDVMIQNGEISAYSVTIDPAQNVLSTNTIIETVKLLPIGVADFIEINIGFTAKI